MSQDVGTKNGAGRGGAVVCFPLWEHDTGGRTCGTLVGLGDVLLVPELKKLVLQEEALQEEVTLVEMVTFVGGFPEKSLSQSAIRRVRETPREMGDSPISLGDSVSASFPRISQFREFPSPPPLDQESYPVLRHLSIKTDFSAEPH